MRRVVSGINRHDFSTRPLQAFLLSHQVFNKHVASFNKKAADLLWSWRLNRLRSAVGQKEQGRQSQRGVFDRKHFSSPFAC
jgi:hypothetical protein